MNNVFLDTSAWFALAEDEAGSDEVISLIHDSWRGVTAIHSCFVTLAELEYVRTQEKGGASATALIEWARRQPVHWHHSDGALCSAAAKLKAAYKISFADSFVAALAQRLNATLVHKDPEFAAVNSEIKQHMLPTKM